MLDMVTALIENASLWKSNLKMREIILESCDKIPCPSDFGLPKIGAPIIILGNAVCAEKECGGCWQAALEALEKEKEVGGECTGNI